MRLSRTYGRNSWLTGLLAGISIHVVFCIQAFAALATGGCMVFGKFFEVVFYPQLMTTVFLCPDTMANYGFNAGIGSVGWGRYLTWLAAAYPASLLYGLALVEAWRFVRHWRAA